MKKCTLYTIILLSCLIAPTQAQVINTLGTAVKQVGSTYYALYDDTEYKKTCQAWHNTIHYYSYSVPGAQLTLQAKIPTSLAVNGEIYMNADESETAVYTISRGSLSKSYQTFGPYSLPRDQRKLYVREGDGSLDRYIRNVHITMASYLDAPSASSLSFSNKLLNSDPETKSFTFDWCNTGTVSVTYSGSSAFSVTTTSFATDGKYGNATISVTCNHNEAGEHTGTVTVTNGTTTYTVSLNAITTQQSQSINWDEPTTNITTADIIQCNAVATSGLPVTYSSSDNSVAQVNDEGTLIIHTIGSVTITATQPGNNNYTAADPVSYTFNITYPQQEWLCLLPANGTTGGDVYISPSDTIYQNLLYYAATTPANLLGNTPLTIPKAQYILLPVYADQWTTFVPPFDITSVQVLEIMPEADLQNLTRTEAVQLQQERADLLTAAICQACTDAATNKATMQEIITAIFQSWTTQYGYADDALGIYPLTHYNGTNIFSADYYAYTTDNTWDLSTETPSGLHKQWQPVPSTEETLFQQGKVYALQFPYCTGCASSDNYDYWSAKLLLLSHTGTQTVYGEEQHTNILAAEPDEGKAFLTGNYTLRTMQATDIYLHETDENNEYYDCFLKHDDAQVLPAQSILFANIPATQRHSPVAIRRTGEIFYPATDDTNITTGHRAALTDASLLWHTDKATLTLLATTPQEVRIYTVSGALLHQMTLAPDNETTLNLPQGTYILQSIQNNTPTNHKIIVY